MGTVNSGNRTFRGGKPSIDSLPCAKVNHQAIFALAAGHGPRVVPGPDGMATVTYGVREWPVMLDTTPLHLGGVRRWLVCSGCSGRRQALYIARDQIRCRQCLDLRFACQHENKRARLFRRMNKVRARLGWQAGLLAANGGKPPRMHWNTYRGLKAELEQLTNALLGNLNDWLDRAEAQFGESSGENMAASVV
jgi:hypothetical protein